MHSVRRDSSPLHCTLSSSGILVPGPKSAVNTTSSTPLNTPKMYIFIGIKIEQFVLHIIITLPCNPSCLHTTFEFSSLHPSSHILPHVLFRQISTLPSFASDPPTSLTSPSSQVSSVMMIVLYTDLPILETRWLIKITFTYYTSIFNVIVAILSVDKGAVQYTVFISFTSNAVQNHRLTNNGIRISDKSRKFRSNCIYICIQ